MNAPRIDTNQIDVDALIREAGELWARSQVIEWPWGESAPGIGAKVRLVEMPEWPRYPNGQIHPLRGLAVGDIGRVTGYSPEGLISVRFTAGDLWLLTSSVHLA